MSDISKSDKQLTTQNDIDCIRKRRKKNDDERDFKCEHCDKTYLSSIALNSHIKIKHSDLVDQPIREKGRPKKQIIENKSEAEEERSKFQSFYNSISRKKCLEEESNLIVESKDLISRFYSEYKDNVFKNKDISKELQFIINPLDDLSYNCIIWKYLQYTHERANNVFFKLVINFIMLLRECISIKMGNGFLDSKYKNMDIIPNIGNEFICDFMDVHNYIKIDKIELLAIYEHFSYWLYINKYTMIKLKMLDN